MNDLLTYQQKVSIATGIILLFSLLFVVFFIVVLIIKTRKNLVSLRNQRFSNKLENKLSPLLTHYEDYTGPQIKEEIKNIKKYARSAWQKDLLASRLLHYRINLAGHMYDAVQHIYLECNLHFYNRKQLRSLRVTTKINAMRILSRMAYKPAWIDIIPYVNDSRKLLRVETSLALMFLTIHPLFFLEKLKKPLTYWQKINVYRNLKRLPKTEIPPFAQWLHSPNHSVVVFALEMIGRFNQVGHHAEVAALMRSTDLRVRSQAVRTLMAIEASDYVDQLIALFSRPNQHKEYLIELITAVGFLGTSVAHRQAIERFLTHKSFDLRFAAARSILKFDGGEELLNASAHREPELLGDINRHLHHPLLTQAG